MKKNYILLLSLSFVFHVAFAQPRVVSGPEKIISPSENTYMNAVWSPDGTQIAFSSDKHSGIWVSDAHGKNIKQVTSDDGAGFGFSWSEDGRSILARSVFTENFRRYHNVKLYDVNSGDTQVILSKSRQLKGLPVFSEGDGIVAMILENKISKVASGKSSLKKAGESQKEALIFGGVLLSVESPLKSTKEVVFPEFKGRYIFNSVTSPLGDKVVFQVNGLGLYVADVDGKNLKQIGFGEQATWMPDGKYVIVTNVGDDGKVVTSGTLSAVNVETGEYFSLLNEKGMVALKPNVSKNGKSLLFENSKDGAIYKVILK